MSRFLSVPPALRRSGFFGLAAVLVFAAIAHADDFQSLYSFDGGLTPNTHLVAIGNTLYGTTPSGGPTGEGIIFALNTDGAQFRTLYGFGAVAGSTPTVGLTAIGSTLYGTTSTDVGGPGVKSNGFGTVFSIGADGSDFQNLHGFDYDYATHGGLSPNTLLTVVGSTLYGGTPLSYPSGTYPPGPGTIYSLAPNGSSFQTLYTYSGANVSDEIAAIGPTLFAAINDYTIVGSHIYGVEKQGGVSGYGDIFSMNLDGTNQQMLYSFTGTGPDGAFPGSGLTLVGSRLYGTTVNGGPALEYGNIFSINLDGSGFRIEHSFVGSDGAYPQGGLTLVGDTLYGTTSSGGLNDAGTVFSFTVPAAQVPEPTTCALLVCGALSALAMRLRRYVMALRCVANRQAHIGGAIIVVVALLGSRAYAAALNPGDIVTFESSTSTLYEIDPTTGVRTILADDAHGTGPALADITGLTVDAQGDIFIASANALSNYPFGPFGSILRVDPVTGNRTTFATMPDQATLAISNNGKLLVGDGYSPTSAIGGPVDIRTIDPASGVTLSTINLVPRLAGYVTSLVEGPTGTYFATIGNPSFFGSGTTLFSVSPTTGAATTLTQTPLTQPTSVTIDNTGSLIYSDSWDEAQMLHRINVATGTDVPFSGSGPSPSDFLSTQTIGTGPAFIPFTGPQSIISSLATEPDGSLIVSGFNGSWSVFRVDPVTGARTILSQVIGTSYASYSPLLVSVVPEPDNSPSPIVPEPSGLVLLGLAGLGMAVKSCRQRLRPAWRRIRATARGVLPIFLGLLSALATVNNAEAAKLVVMATDATSVPGAKVFTVAVEITKADVAQGGGLDSLGKDVQLLVQNITFEGGPDGPIQQAGGANRSELQSIQSGPIDNAAEANSGPPTNAALGAMGFQALYQDSWWYAGSGALTGVIDSTGDNGTVTTNPAADGSGLYTLGPTTNVGTTGYIFQVIGPLANTTTGQTMSLTGILGVSAANFLDQAPLADAFVNGVLDVPLAQIVASGNIDLGFTPNAISFGQSTFNVLGGNPLFDPHAHLDYALNQIVVPEPATLVTAIVCVAMVGAFKRARRCRTIS